MTDDALRDLIPRLAKGDAEAWTAFDLAYRAWLTGRVRHAARVRNWFWITEQEDLVQEAFALFNQRLVEKRFRYQSEPQLKVFLIRAAFFVAMRWKRSARILTRPLEAREGERAISDLPATDWVAAAWEASDRRRCLELLVGSLSTLIPARRQVLELSLVGLKPSSIAERMGKTAGAISCLKFHALADLKRALDATKFRDECADTLEIQGGA